METMRAIDIEGGQGPLSSLFMASDVPKPIPSNGQALVRVRYFGLNRMDVTQRNGQYQVPPQAGKILGVEFSGVIEEFGDPTSDNDGFNVGDEVFGLAYGGAYADYVPVSTLMLIHKPEEIPWAVAAGIPEAWITATQALMLVGEFSSGKSVLWHAGASSVSIAGIQMSKAFGASVIYSTVGSQEKVDFCKSLGATEVWNYRVENWEEELKRVTDGTGVDLIIDFVGQNYFQMNLNSAARDGHIVIVGLLSGPKTTEGVDLSSFVKQRIRVEGSRLRSRAVSYQSCLRNILVKDALPKFIDGTLKVPIEKIFDWSDIQDAHRLMESNTTMGKIICRVT